VISLEVNDNNTNTERYSRERDRVLKTGSHCVTEKRVEMVLHHQGIKTDIRGELSKKLPPAPRRNLRKSPLSKT